MNLSAVSTITQWLGTSPNASVSKAEVIHALLTLEKTFKKETPSAIADDFSGSWQLRFVGGKQTLNSATQNAKNGKRLPPWLNIQLTYSQMLRGSGAQIPDRGHLSNRVQIGPFVLELRGPWKYIPKTQIIAFDFLFLRFNILKRSVLDIPIRGGEAAEASFWDQPLKEQAFFRYFWVTPDAIAARGKGGGLALWSKVPH